MKMDIMIMASGTIKERRTMDYTEACEWLSARWDAEDLEFVDYKDGVQRYKAGLLPINIMTRFIHA